ncbi:MAG TPA: CinA family protein [Ghiorsea sp.]|nr:CinA family protein [Ghiorsea sp.]HIP07355.1 CinA family protein [Mariprofundaceae bacterium]
MNKAEELVTYLQSKGWKLRCVESCTAGGLSAAVGAVAGVSSVLDRSWVTYSNLAKHEEVGVPLGLIETYGAVSEEVVLAMAEGAIKGCESNTLSLSISGIAGPDGGTVEKPVGMVWIGLKAPQQQTIAQCFHFKGARLEVQQQAISQALAMPLQE